MTHKTKPRWLITDGFKGHNLTLNPEANFPKVQEHFDFVL